MAETGLTQTELAKRIGVTQGAIAKIARNSPNGSSFLHLLARELRTTPAYLTGETDDPDADAPQAPPLSYEQLELVNCYTRLKPSDKAALLQIARSMAAAETGQSKMRLHDRNLGFSSEGE